MKRASILFVLLSLAAFGPVPSSAEPEVVTGLLRLPVRFPMRGLDPAVADHESERLVIVNLFDQLYEYEHLARPFALRPCLAADMPEVSADRRTYTIRLKKGVRFSDDVCFEGGKGREVTAHDVVFCFKRLMDANVPATGRWLFEKKLLGIDAFTQASAGVPKKPNRSSYTKEQGYPPVAGLEAVDDHTVRFRLSRPYPALVWVLAASYASIYPPEAVAKYGADLGKHPVGSGAYVLQSYPSERRVTLRRNPGYRKDLYPSQGAEDDTADDVLADAGAQLPLNSLVSISVVPDEAEAWNRFNAGEFDLCVVPRDAVWSIVTPGNLELLPFLAEKGVRLSKVPKLEVFYQAFNMENEIVGHPAGEKGLAIRRAISLAHADTWTRERLYGGLVERLYGPILPEFPEYDTGFQNPWMRQEGEPEEDALELAREVLEEAGIPGGKGVPPIPIDMLDFKAHRTEFAEFQKNMSKIGLRFEPTYVDWPTLRKRIASRKSVIWTISWQMDYPDPENLLQLFYGPHKHLPNDSGYTSKAFDELYEQALQMPPGDERAAVYLDMQEMIVEACAYRWQFRRRKLVLTHEWLSNWRYNDICPKYFKYCRVDTGKRNKYLAARK
ncbi:MAG: ABC transporter substrate-binding protein [Planctomycetota bacterium]|nr:ABC transporter substrate-binding protein [Planctomycetota bacterium]